MCLDGINQVYHIKCKSPPPPPRLFCLNFLTLASPTPLLLFSWPFLPSVVGWARGHSHIPPYHWWLALLYAHAYSSAFASPNARACIQRGYRFCHILLSNNHIHKQNLLVWQNHMYVEVTIISSKKPARTSCKRLRPAWKTESVVVCYRTQPASRFMPTTWQSSKKFSNIRDPSRF